MVLVKLEIHMQQNEIKPPISHPEQKLNSKWIKDTGIRPETLQIIEEKVGPNLQHVGLGSDFLNRTPIAQERKARINHWDRFKLKSFLSAKETISNAKREPTEWENIFANHTSDRALISESIKNSKNSTPRVQIIQSINGLRK